MKEGPLGETLPASNQEPPKEATSHVARRLDLSRNRLDVCLLFDEGEIVEEFKSPADLEGLSHLHRRIARHGEPVRGVVESMTGARFVHDTLERLGFDVLIADAQRAKGLAPRTCKTDKTDARVLAVLSERCLVPESWLPDPSIRAEREPARFRLQLVKHRSALKNRVHSTLISFGKPCPVTDLFGLAGRALLQQLALPEPWRRSLDVSLQLIDELDLEIAELGKELRQSSPDHRYVPLLLTVPGIGWVLAFTIAAEIGDSGRFASPTRLCGYTGLCPRVVQSGSSDRRGPLTRHGPKYLRWALLEATIHALRHPACSERYQRTKKRLGKQRGAKVAQVEVARRLTRAIWHMLSNNEPFNAAAPGGAALRLAA
jgi:transposase